MGATGLVMENERGLPNWKVDAPPLPVDKEVEIPVAVGATLLVEAKYGTWLTVLVGAKDGRGPTVLAGAKDGRVPTVLVGAKDGRVPTVLGGAKDGRGPTVLAGAKDGRGPTVLAGAKDSRGPTVLIGAKDGRVPTLLVGVKDGIGPTLLVGAKDGRGPALLVGAKDGRGPTVLVDTPSGEVWNLLVEAKGCTRPLGNEGGAYVPDGVGPIVLVGGVGPIALVETGGKELIVLVAAESGRELPPKPTMENCGKRLNIPVDGTGATVLVDVSGSIGLTVLVVGMDLPIELKIGDFAGDTEATPAPVDNDRGLIDEEDAFAEADAPKMLTFGSVEIP